MFFTHKKPLIFSMLLCSQVVMNLEGLSESVVVSVNDSVILASDVDNGQIFNKLEPSGIDDLVSFSVFREKANKLSIFSPSSIKVDEFKKIVFQKLGIEDKTKDEVNKTLRAVLGVDENGLNEKIIDHFKVRGLLETFVFSKSTVIYNDDVETYCKENPKYTHPEFSILVSENFTIEKFNELRLKNANNDEFEKVIGLKDGIEIVLNSSEASKALVEAVNATEINSISEPIASEKVPSEVFVVKVLSKSPERLLSSSERYNEVCELLSAKNIVKLSEQFLAEARKECAIQYNVQKDTI